MTDHSTALRCPHDPRRCRARLVSAHRDHMAAGSRAMVPIGTWSPHARRCRCRLTLPRATKLCGVPAPICTRITAAEMQQSRPHSVHRSWYCRIACGSHRLDEDRLGDRRPASAARASWRRARSTAGERLTVGTWHWEVLAAPGTPPGRATLFEATDWRAHLADALWQNGFGVVFPELDGLDAFDRVAETLALIGRIAPVRGSFPVTARLSVRCAGRIAARRQTTVPFCRESGTACPSCRQGSAEISLDGRAAEALHAALFLAETTPLFESTRSRAGFDGPPASGSRNCWPNCWPSAHCASTIGSGFTTSRECTHGSVARDARLRPRHRRGAASPAPHGRSTWRQRSSPGWWPKLQDHLGARPSSAPPQPGPDRRGRTLSGAGARHPRRRDEAESLVQAASEEPHGHCG